MEDITILLVLLSIVIFFILLFAIIKFIFIDKRSFTFEIINIPLGIFKFDKRDEYIKNNAYEKVKTESIEECHMEIENDHNNLVDENLLNKAEAFNEVSTDEKGIQENIEETEEVIKLESIDNFPLEEKEITPQANIESNKSNNDCSKVSDIIHIINEDKQTIIDIDDEEFLSDDIVYWTASGKVYHTSKKCRTLSRSKVIFDGTREDSGRYQECIHCK